MPTKARRQSHGSSGSSGSSLRQTSLTRWLGMEGKLPCQCTSKLKEMDSRLGQLQTEVKELKEVNSLLMKQLEQLVELNTAQIVKEEPDKVPATVPDEDLEESVNVGVQDATEAGEVPQEIVDDGHFHTLNWHQEHAIEISDDETEKLHPSLVEAADATCDFGARRATDSWDTQASQQRLLLKENRTELGDRFTRSEMAARPLGAAPQPLGDLEGRSAAELLDLILKELDRIPEASLRSTSRKNVRPEGQNSTLQMLLGLMISARFHGIPQWARWTGEYMQLQRLIFAYVKVRAKELDMDLDDFTWSSVQITKNLKTKRHKDKNNRGISLMFTVGDHRDGELFIDDETGEAELEGVKGNKIEVRNSLKFFDGNHKHGTMPFSGKRYAIILFAIGTEHYKQTPARVRAFLAQLGYQMPLAEFKEEIKEEHVLHAQMIVRGENVPDEPGRHMPPKGKRKTMDPTTPRPEASKRRSTPVPMRNRT
mmetsp:Transcript_55761/g.130112  ORF Transcript_55761/g.130112 Transcript_55761/m.130112 type:complete len:482 (-) Transcript_55761:118-1563(-)